MIAEIIKKNRSYRRFFEDRSVDADTLVSVVNEARLCPSGANLQRLRVAIINDEKGKKEIFSTLKFAGYLKEWAGPAEGERPAAYLVVCSEADLDSLLAIDLGIFAQTVLLSATERGIGGCMFRSYDAARVAAIVGVNGMKPHLVIALGYPSESVEVVGVNDGNIKYYRGEDDVHYVPKYSAEELIIKR